MVFQGELSAAVKKYWYVFSGRKIYIEAEKANSRQVGLFYSVNLRWIANRYPNVNKPKWLTVSLILCQKPGMDRNYCLIEFIVYMSYSDTYKVAKCCLYENKWMLKKKNKKKRGGGHRVLSTRTCAYGQWSFTNVVSETNRNAMPFWRNRLWLFKPPNNL